MFTHSLTKTRPLIRFPERKFTYFEPVTERDDASCPYKEAWRRQKEEERYLIKVAMIPLAILLISALAMLVYLILNPDAFMIPNAP